MFTWTLHLNTTDSQFELDFNHQNKNEKKEFFIIN